KDGLPLEPPAITVPVTVPDELISRGDGENDGVAVAMVTVPVPDVPLFEAASVSTPAIEIPVGLMELPAAITTFPLAFPVDPCVVMSTGTVIVPYAYTPENAASVTLPPAPEVFAVLNLVSPVRSMLPPWQHAPVSVRLLPPSAVYLTPAIIVTGLPAESIDADPLTKML